MDVKTPKSLAMEHEELLKELEAGFVGGGKVAEAARRLMEMIRPHFATEEELVLPPLSLLSAIAAGNITEEMKEVQAVMHEKLTDADKAEIKRSIDFALNYAKKCGKKVSE